MSMQFMVRLNELEARCTALETEMRTLKQELHDARDEAKSEPPEVPKRSTLTLPGNRNA